jgi:hypothetical protein
MSFVFALGIMDDNLPRKTQINQADKREIGQVRRNAPKILAMKGILSKTLNDSERLVLELLAKHRHVARSGREYFLAVSTKELVKDAEKLGDDALKLGKNILRSSFYAPIQALRKKDLINIKEIEIPCEGAPQQLSKCTLKINKKGRHQLAEWASKNLLPNSWDPQI